MLNVLDEFTLECLEIRVDRKLKSTHAIDVLSDLFILRGVPEQIRSDHGPESVAGAVENWIAAVGAKTDYIEPCSPWEKGYIESFNARLRDELLAGEIFCSIGESIDSSERRRVCVLVGGGTSAIGPVLMLWTAPPSEAQATRARLPWW